MKTKASTKPRAQTGEATGSRHETPEFSRMVDVDDIPAAGLDLTIAADDTECAALARRAGLLGVQSLAIDFHLRKVKGAEVEVEGVLRARVVQTCVVSLEPFESDVESPIEVDFAGPAATDFGPARVHRELDDRAGSATIRGGELDAPDPIIDGRIDLGALASEFLMLALDPYPRKPGVSFDESGWSTAGAETTSPFAALRAVRGPSNGKD